jgi:hypothetical protein
MAKWPIRMVYLLVPEREWRIELAASSEATSTERWGKCRSTLPGSSLGAGPGPPPPPDPDADIEPGALTAWKAATGRFSRTGLWLARWRTCQTCGRVILPDTDAEYCQEHLPGTGIPAR